MTRHGINIMDRGKNRRADTVTHLQANNVAGWTRVRTACGRRLDDQKSWAVTTDEHKVTCSACTDAMEPT